jgi:3-hydroxybutyryl-CoA dehydrogenase
MLGNEHGIERAASGCGIASCGVVGGGTMGLGIAHVLLDAGVAVRLVEADEALAGAARAKLAENLRRAEERGRLVRDPAQCLAQFSAGADLAALSSVELAIEAVPETVALKVAVLSALEAVLSPSAPIATNTSSLSLGELATALRDPSRLVGLHFFNPVPASALVEVVVAPLTADWVTAAAHRLAAGLGKQTIEVHDAPGFATSRLGVALGLEAIRMVEQGVATSESIDQAMVLGYRHPVGPLRLTDLVGLDVRLDIAQYLFDRLGERFAPPELLRAMVADGALGKKAGRGFYVWD